MNKNEWYAMFGLVIVWIGLIIWVSIPDPEAAYRGPCPCAQHTEEWMTE